MCGPRIDSCDLYRWMSVAVTTVRPYEREVSPVGAAQVKRVAVPRF